MAINGIEEMAIDSLTKTAIGAEIKKVLQTYERIREAAEVLNTSDEKKELVKIRIGTMLTLGVADRISKGKLPKNYSKDDWLELVNMISEYAVEIEDQEYSALIFNLYADYIETSANTLAGRVSEDTLNSIRPLAEELREKTKAFQNNDIDEVDYTEECLWICLEAMLKLLSAVVTKYAGHELGRLAEGVSAVAFEYGRLVLYRMEQELLKQYIENQRVLDKELQEKYAAYLCELDAQAASFRELINNAFDPDFRTALKGSVEFARAVGVSEKEILSSKEDIDGFFLD